MEIAHIDHVAIAVSDVERSIEWYRDVLGMEPRHPEWGTAPAMVCAGDTCLALFAVEGELQPPPGRNAVAMRHLAFRVDRAGFARAQDELRERGIDFEFMDHETAHSVYFADPDGHRLEVTTYELESAAGVVRRAHEAFNRGDLEAFVALWSEDCQYRPGVESGLEGREGVYLGHDGLRRWWDTMHRDWQEMSTQIEEIDDVGDRALAIVSLRTKGPASGLEMETRLAQLFTVRDGKVVECRDFFDAGEAARAAGLAREHGV